MKLVAKDHLSSSSWIETFHEWFNASDFLLIYFSPERMKCDAGIINYVSSHSWITLFRVSVHFIVIMNTVLRYCNSIHVYPRFYVLLTVHPCIMLYIKPT